MKRDRKRWEMTLKKICHNCFVFFHWAATDFWLGWLDTYFQLLSHKREKSCWWWPENAKPAFIRSFGLLVIDMVEYFCQDFAPNMMMVVHFFRRHHQFCHRRRTNIITSHSIGAERLQLKRANFLLLPTIRLKPPLTNTFFCSSELLCSSFVLCTVLSIFCILLDRLTQPRLTLYQEYPSYLVNARK